MDIDRATRAVKVYFGNHEPENEDEISSDGAYIVRPREQNAIVCKNLHVQQNSFAKIFWPGWCLRIDRLEKLVRKLRQKREETRVEMYNYLDKIVNPKTRSLAVFFQNKYPLVTHPDHGVTYNKNLPIPCGISRIVFKLDARDDYHFYRRAPKKPRSKEENLTWTQDSWSVPICQVPQPSKHTNKLEEFRARLGTLNHRIQLVNWGIAHCVVKRLEQATDYYDQWETVTFKVGEYEYCYQLDDHRNWKEISVPKEIELPPPVEDKYHSQLFQWVLYDRKLPKSVPSKPKKKNEKNKK